MVEYLLSEGASVQEISKLGIAALEYVEDYGYDNVAKVLR